MPLPSTAPQTPPVRPASGRSVIFGRTAQPVPVPTALAAHDVSHRFAGTLALDGASIDVPAGHALAMVGESGSGKTTLLRCFNRLVEPERGAVRVGDADVRTLDPVALRRRVGYVPQDGGLLPHWRVSRNAALVPTLLGWPDAADAARAAHDLVGLSPERFGARFPHELSGGQRQRVALARALAARPEVILLDEPFGALDAITRDELQETFARVRHAVGTTTLLVTHDLAEAVRLGDEIAVMRAGRVEQCAPIDRLLAAPDTEYVAALVGRVRDGTRALLRT